MDLPTTVEQILYIHLDAYTKRPTIFTHDMTDCDYLLLGTHTVTVPIPQDVDLVQLQITTLETHKTALENEHFVKVRDLDERIQSLLALEHKI